MTDTKTHSEAATEKEAFTQTFTGLPLRKLRQLLAGGWAVNGVSIERTGEGGAIQRVAVTTGGMVLWWNHVMQLPPVGKMMLWDAEDPESTGGPWHDIVGALEGIGGNRDLNVGDEVTLMCAIEQPSYRLRITSIPGEDSDSFERVGFELVGPVAPAQQAPVQEPLSFNCSAGCGACGVKLQDFVTHQTQAQEGDEWVVVDTQPQIVSTCCGSPVEVWDERKQDITASVDATPPAQPAPVQEQALPEFFAALEYNSPDWDVFACVYRRRADATPELVHREQLPLQAPAAQPAAPDFKDFMAWANDAGYDTAYTHDGIKWICLNPMTADLWKAWQAATPPAALDRSESRQSKPAQEPVAWTAREMELIDGMIRVQLDHAERCDHIGNRTMAEKQKNWDMERVALLQKIRATPLAQPAHSGAWKIADDLATMLRSHRDIKGAEIAESIRDSIAAQPAVPPLDRGKLRRMWLTAPDGWGFYCAVDQALFGKGLPDAATKPAHKEPIAKVCHDLEGHIGWNPALGQLPPEGTHLFAGPARTCTWTPSGDPNMPGTWAGSCGAMWTFTEDGPVENGLHFCHKCGGELIIEEATHADA